LKFKKKPSGKYFPVGKQNDKVVISSEYYQNDRPSYLCSICNCTLSKLQDAGQNNTMYFCTRCSVEFDPQEENLRKESKITVPERNEPAVASIGFTPDVSIRHEPELKGAFKVLKDKGLRFTHYEEH
jgi:DNA-directed RNA polymerase subunit RPC12/RpoP